MQNTSPGETPKTQHIGFRILVVVAMTLTACGGNETLSETTHPPSPSSTPAVVATTSRLDSTTTVVDRCAEATDETVATFETMLDRIDADPAGMLADSSTMQELSHELGVLIGTECGEERAGEALSELLVYLADQATARPSVTADVIQGILQGICPNPPVELTRQGRAACTGAR